MNRRNTNNPLADFPGAEELVLPRELLLAAGIGPEDELEITIEEGRITIGSAAREARLPYELADLLAELGISPKRALAVLEGGLADA